MGTQRIADVLARAGLHLSKTSVRRYLEQPRPAKWPSATPPPAATNAPSGRTVTAQYPGHVFNVDLTTVATALGFWVPWIPQAIAQCWPFCWWVGVVMDHLSRRVVGFALWRQEPTAAEVTAMLDTAAAVAGRYPRHLISDRRSDAQRALLRPPARSRRPSLRSAGSLPQPWREAPCQSRDGRRAPRRPVPRPGAPSRHRAPPSRVSSWAPVSRRA